MLNLIFSRGYRRSNVLQQQQCILFKFHKAYNTLCSANNYSANLDRTKKIINKRVIKLHIKKKRGEKKYKNTQKEKPLTQTQVQGFWY